jgi:hypothetical protein
VACAERHASVAVGAECHASVAFAERHASLSLAERHASVAVGAECHASVAFAECHASATVVVAGHYAGTVRPASLAQW